MTARPISYYLAPALLVLGTALAAANWYLQPQRAGASVVALLLLACMTLALASRRSPEPPSEGDAARSHFADSIRTGIVFAGLIVVVSLGAKLATALGAAGGADLSQRAMMAILGAFLVFTGNAIPKRLTPLSALRGDPARVQTIQRLAGWTWVLTGLAFAAAWLALPLGLAGPLTLLLLPGAMLISVVQIVRLRRAGQRAV